MWPIIAVATLVAKSPEIRMMPTPPRPGAVACATIVSVVTVLPIKLIKEKAANQPPF